jgi:hypothetical protein
VASRDVAVWDGGCGCVQGHSARRTGSSVLAGYEQVHGTGQYIGEFVQHERALMRDDRPLYPDDEPSGTYLLVLAGRVVAEAIQAASYPRESLRLCVMGEELRTESPLLGLSRREKTILGVGEAVECRKIGFLFYVRYFYSILLVYADKHVVSLIASWRSA